MSDISIIESSQIKSFSISVSEKIKDDHILSFIRTNIDAKDIILDNNTYFYYTFIPQSLTYEVLVFEKSSDDFLLEPFLYIDYSEELKGSTNLFIDGDCFIIVQNNQLLVYKYIKGASQDDIIEFISQIYKFNIDNIVNVNTQQKQSLIEKQNQTIEYDIHPFFVDNSYKFFKIFFVFITIAFSALLFDAFLNNKALGGLKAEVKALEKRYDNLMTIYKKNNKKPIDRLQNFFEYIKKHKIQIDRVKYNNEKIEMTLIDEDKKLLIDIVTKYKSKVLIKNIKFYQSEKRFKMEVHLDV